MYNFFNKKQKTGGYKKGFTIPEILVFIVVFVLVLSSVISTTIILSSLFKEMKITRAMSKDAAILLEKLSFEVRAAESVDVANSILNSNPGKLMLLSNAGASTTEIYKENGLVRLKKNTVAFGGLTSSSTVVSNLVFRLLDNNGQSKAVKTEITLSASSSSGVLTRNFYLTTILRGSY